MGFIREEQLRRACNCRFGEGGVRAEFFWLFNVFKVINQLTVVLKQLYSWPKKLNQFITNLIFLANIQMPGQVQYHIEKNLTTSYLCRWLTGLMERYLPLKYYTCMEVHTDKAWESKSAVSCTSRQNKHNFNSICCFSFKIKQQDLII